MADSMGGSFKPSEIRKQEKAGRIKKNAATASRNTDTPEAREARIRLYTSRLWANPEDEKCKIKRTGEGGMELNIFTGKELTPQDLEVDEIEEEEEE